MFKFACIFILCFIGIFALTAGCGWLAEGNDFLLFKFFAPRREAARREVYEQSKAYNDGMAQELRQAQIDWIKGDKDQRAAIGAVVLHRTAGYPMQNLPYDLVVWVGSLQPERSYTPRPADPDALIKPAQEKESTTAPKSAY